MADKIKINLADLLSAAPVKIPTKDCTVGTGQAAQSGRDVTDPDDPLVKSIKDMGGLIHPIIVKQFEEEGKKKYDVITGQRRMNAHLLLEMDEIKAFVIDRDLSEDEKKVISFAENVGQKKMDRADYVDVIEYFYIRYGADGMKSLKEAADTLGISRPMAEEYLIEARIPREIQEHIDAGEFTIDTAIKALKALGDDTESVDVDVWIETSKGLKELKPTIRKKIADLMKKHPEWTQKEAEEYYEKLQKKKENILTFEATDTQLEKLDVIKEQQKSEDDRNDIAAEVFDKGLQQYD